MTTIKFKNGTPFVEGNYDFKVSSEVDYTNLIPTKDITFKWNVEMEQDINVNENEAFEMLAEQLKCDFLKFLKT